jgi:hypothetical protein
LDSFEELQEYLLLHEIILNKRVKANTEEHWKTERNQFSEYFPETGNSHKLEKNPFEVCLPIPHLATHKKENLWILLHMNWNQILKTIFSYFLDSIIKWILGTVKTGSKNTDATLWNTSVQNRIFIHNFDHDQQSERRIQPNLKLDIFLNCLCNRNFVYWETIVYG